MLYLSSWIMFLSLLIMLLLCNLISSYNNVIFIFNFIGLLFIFIFILFIFNLINITLFMLLIYMTLINLLFLVNGLLLISCNSYTYLLLSAYFIINNHHLNLDLTLAFIIPSFIFIPLNNLHNNIIYISTIHFYNLYYLSNYSILFNLGLNRLGHFIFDNSLFCLLFLLFIINLINLNKIYL